MRTLTVVLLKIISAVVAWSETIVYTAAARGTVRLQTGLFLKGVFVSIQ